MMGSHVQLNFCCPRCTLAGLTPEVTAEEGFALTKNELELACPKCGAILEIRGSSSQWQRLQTVTEPGSLIEGLLRQLHHDE